MLRGFVIRRSCLIRQLGALGFGLPFRRVRPGAVSLGLCKCFGIVCVFFVGDGLNPSTGKAER